MGFRLTYSHLTLIVLKVHVKVMLDSAKPGLISTYLLQVLPNIIKLICSIVFFFIMIASVILVTLTLSDAVVIL